MSAVQRPRQLPEHVRSIVDEIETEIGETPWRPEAEIEGPGSGAVAEGGVFAA